MLKKRILTIVMVIALLLSCTVFVSAEKTRPISLESPKNLALRLDGDSVIYLRWTNPASILNIVKDIEDAEYYADFSYLVDWKKNDGNWNVAVLSSDPAWDDDYHGQFSGNMPNVMFDENGVAETFFVTWHLDPINGVGTTYDLSNDTYYFRMRYLLEPSLDEDFDPIYSSYSEVAAIGKNAEAETVTKLDPPQNVKVEVKKDSGNKPYFQLDWTIPESITAANKILPVYHIVDFKVGNGKWLSETIPWDGLPSAYSEKLASTYDINPVEKNLVDKVVIEENIYYFRVAYVCEPSSGNPVISAYSNIASTKIEAYSDASPWAKPELDKADNLGIITDTLRGSDMTKPITREEFAESAVKFYEMVTGKKAEPHPTEKFIDCTNPEVLKARNLGIVYGVGEDKFLPKDYLLRQQMAAMITRTLSACYEDLVLDVTGVPDFKDQHQIAAYANTPTKFMAKYKITVGDGKGNFIPNNNCSRQEAIAFLLRSYLYGDQYLPQ